MQRSDTPELDAESQWMSAGNCRNYPPAVFFPSDGVGVDRARKICTDCPVINQCLEYALDQRIEHGVWGGCSERERPRILRRRRLPPCPRVVRHTREVCRRPARPRSRATELPRDE